MAVIGANGQLGSDLVKAFEDVIPLTHKDIEVTDLSSCEILKELKPDVVINTAAYHNTTLERFSPLNQLFECWPLLILL